MGAGERVADGVTFHRVDTTRVVGLPQPLAVQALVLDPRHVELTCALALGRQQGRATVIDAARREQAIAAVNASFFVLASGDPTGVLRVDGDLVSDARLMRGAAAMASGPGGPRLTFDRVRVRLSAAVRTGGAWRETALDGVDAVRRLAGTTLFTPHFGPNTGTPPTGVEWAMTVDAKAAIAHVGRSVTVTRSAVVTAIGSGPTPIPAAGAVLSFAGDRPPAPLDRLAAGVRVRLREAWETQTPHDAEAFARADDVVGGAGLLLKDGHPISDWTVEQTSDSLRTVRHPRTMLGADARGAIWLVTVDGRQPGYSAGVTMLELQVLARALGLTGALNLDGGGSTTMVVKGEVRNRPSDVTGPRTVSDVLLVRPRPVPRSGARR
jgi:Phosphodiester glycosidase